MRNGLLAAMWLAAVGLALGQPPAKDPPADTGRTAVGEDTAPAVSTGPAVSTPPAPPADGGSAWARAEYLWWRVKDGPVPVPLAHIGGTVGSIVVLGGQDVDFGEASGGRLSGGLWLDAGRTLGVEASGFLLEKVSATSGVGSDATGRPMLSRPFISTTGLPAAFAVSIPDLFAGNLSLYMHSEFWGAEANLRYSLWCDCDGRADGLVGFRYLGLGEKLVVDQFQSNIPGALRDRYYTTNHFFGAQVGAETEYWFDRWFVSALGKAAAGSTHYRINPSNNGLLVRPTNRGQHSGDTYAWASEAEFRIGCQLNGCVRAYIGYSCLYWDGVVRPGDQIDPVINPATLADVVANPARPAVTFRETDFWAQGLTIGVEVRY